MIVLLITRDICYVAHDQGRICLFSQISLKNVKVHKGDKFE